MIKNNGKYFFLAFKSKKEQQPLFGCKRVYNYKKDQSNKEATNQNIK